MSDEADEELGIQAFGDMARAMDRLGATLKAVDHRQQVRLADEEREASAARQAASKAAEAASKAQNAAQTALQAARIEFRSSMLWTGLSGLLLLLTAFLGGFWIGNRDGWDQGQASGYTSARNQVAAASWANTPSGQRAWTLDQLGSLDRLTDCSAPGWVIRERNGRRVCFPGNDPQGSMTGWLLP